MPIIALLPKAGVAPTGIIPSALVEMDLGNVVNGGIWDVGLWDSTFIWGPIPATYPEDISAWLRSFNTNRGASRETERIEAGGGTLDLDGRDGRFTPFLAASPYYPNILPMRRIRISAVWEATPYRVFTGFVESWPVSFPQHVDQVVRVQLVDGFTVLSRVKVSGDFPEQQSGARIGAILDAAGWLDSDRDIDAGNATVPAITLENVVPLEHIQQIAYAEGGRFFMARDGKATFRDSTTEANVDLSDRTWADDGSGMSYRDVTLVFDDTLILNDIRLTRTGGSEQSASSTSSQDAYGVRSKVETDIQLSTDGQVLGFAENLRARFSQPVLRLEQLVDNAMLHRLWNQVLQRELTDVANAIETRTQTAQVSTIEGISHAVADGAWTITVNLSPTTVIQAGIWDDAVYGLWDSTFIWAR